MSPANIEAKLKAASPLIGQVCAIGDDRPYNVALVTLDADFAPVFAQQHGIEDLSPASLAAEPAILAGGRGGGRARQRRPLPGRAGEEVQAAAPDGSPAATS